MRFSVHHYYCDYCIKSERASHGVSESRIVLNLSGFRISGLLFLRLRSYYIKPASAVPAALKPDHAYAIIQAAKSSNENLFL